jgi:hypothetical protein
MFEDGLDSKLTITIIGGLFGLASTGVPILEKWMRERTERNQRDQHLERITKQVTFWDAWFKAQQNVCSQDELQRSKATAARELDHLSPNDWLMSTAAGDRQLFPKSYIRRLLLIYKPARRSAWIPRVFFYASLLYLCTTVFVTLWRHPNAVRDPLVWLVLSLVLTFVWVFRFLALGMQSQWK